MHLELALLPERFAVCRLDPTSEMPRWAEGGAFVSVTRTPRELSVVCPAQNVPPGTACADEGWRCFQVAGPLDFSQVGVIASLVAPLAAARVSVFTIATYETDYLLVQETHLEDAIDALTDAGHRLFNPERD